ncbi:methyltransferase family protein [Consotaella salsifontis]|uniref:Protein-S-isoprenylcysteine O-methyltransferase Ste14 n=1 Tax=Consotaella salsifontis TaxID=1365950 RepID=A0A1T4S752_9HYPH|nr:isoprenylcysteine carboxylmethyltransferase family protein [Consotaella salsifontis]SKA23896.1 Protein-S-isoprenylcysteine O-methyltransferase Ste14 [Consotaella salsifontis]
MSLARYQRLRRLVLAFLLLLVLLALLFVRSSWQDEDIHEMIEQIGLGIIVVGIVGRIWCTLYIGGRKSAEIVEAGPYSVTRNPLYVFSTLAAAGLGAQSGSLTIALLTAIGCYIAFNVVIRREEKFLSEKFGAPYRSYLERVPRFWPKPSLFRDSPELNVNMRRVYATLYDGLVFFAAMPVLEFVEILQDKSILPVLLRLP